MNTTASLDYAVVSSSVSAELEALRDEKKALEETIKNTHARLTEISRREQKLARLSETLNELLNGSPDADEIDLSSTFASVSSAQASDAAVSGAEQTATSSQTNQSNNDAPPPSQRGRTDFRKSEFLKKYPHLKGAQQPIHVLAGKVLEFMDRPLKLKDLTAYILELGYRHGSQNFTNSVHTVLKYKRDHNKGSFYFEPKARLWMLGHWRDSDAAQNDSADLEDGEEADAEVNDSPDSKANKSVKAILNVEPHPLRAKIKVIKKVRL